MGVDMEFYVQRRKVNGITYETLPIHKKDGTPVCIWRRGREKWDWVRDQAAGTITWLERRMLAIDTKWYVPSEDEEPEIPTYDFSLSHLKNLAAADYEDDEGGEDKKRFWTDLLNEVEVMLNLADEFWYHPDNVRIVCFVSY